MWVLRFLTGPMAGQTFPLKKHSTLIGRSPSCDIKITSSSVSKEHTRIEVFEDKLVISDAGSRNGTFLNGVQIRSSKAHPGDRISIHDVIAEVQAVPDQWAAAPQMFLPYQGNVAQQYQPAPMPHHSEEEEPAEAKGGLSHKIPLYLDRASKYFDRDVLPGIYKLPEMFEFKWVLAGFMGVFILLVTSLSTVPLIRILKNGLEEESRQHALTIATTLAKVNRPALMNGTDSNLSVDIAMSRPGVKRALIISNLDGNIMAPAAQAGTYPDLPFIHNARRSNKETVSQIDDNTIAAVVPIDFYNPETGTQSVAADAVVFYDMSSIAVDTSEELSLFISTLFIALLIGSIIYYFLYKIVEYPFKSINAQLDAALKEGHDTITVKYRFAALQTLASNVSSALSRALNGVQEAGGKIVEHDRNREIANIVELIGFAAMGLHSHDLSIAAVNQAFESRTSITPAQAAHMTVNDIMDQALKLSVKDLIERVDKNPDELASNELEFSGQQFQVIAQGIYGASKISYYLVVLLPAGDE